MKTKIKNLEIKLCYPVEKIFNDIVNSITDIKTDKKGYSNRIFYFSNDKCIIDYSSKNKYFWCNYDKFWSKFYLNNDFNYQTIQYLLNPMVEEHFKLKEITTNSGSNSFCNKVEEHFKLKEITTNN